MNTVEEYHEQALEQLRLSETGSDMRHRTHQIERAAVLAELAKTAEYEEVDPIGPVASVTPLPRASDDILTEGAPDGWRWATYEEAFEALGVDRSDVDKASNRRGVQIVVKL